MQFALTAPGDRSHIPEAARPAFTVISGLLEQVRQTTPVSIRVFSFTSQLLISSLFAQPQQKRLVDDLERRINPLFDALNCETLSQPVVDQLLVLTRGMTVYLLLYNR